MVQQNLFNEKQHYLRNEQYHKLNINRDNYQLAFSDVNPQQLYNRDMTQIVQQYLNKGLVHYDHFKQIAYQQVQVFWPRVDNFNHFELFIILNLVIIGIYLIVSCIASFSLKSIYHKIMKLVFDLPPVKRFILSEVEKARKEIFQNYPKNMLVENKKIPYKPPNSDLGDASQKQSLKGRASGSRYATQNHSKFIINLAKNFAYINPLHADEFPLVKQMQSEIVAMTADFIGLKDEQTGKVCGTAFSGGTQSITMAIYTYREFMMKERGVIRPNLIICQTGHVAAIKASNYFDVEIRIIPFDKNYQMNIRKMKNAIDENTICVYVSYPNYPIGTLDQADVIGSYCQKKGIPVHADMCLGGFVIPFLEGWKCPKGITSISADVHKYGLSAKGISVLLFSSEKYRKYQFFITQYWPGGLYGTPGFAGSRSGVFIASAWISMMKLGRKGFEQNAKLIQNTIFKVSEEFKKLGFEILVKNPTCVISFKHKTIPVNAILTFIKTKGWGFSITQKPLCFQFSFTPLSCQKSDEMIKDMKECIEHYTKNGYPTKQSSELAMYGGVNQIKDDGKKSLMVSMFMDAFIDLQD